jgi:hypothetical protein
MLPNVLVKRARRIAFKRTIWIGDTGSQEPLRRVQAHNLSQGGMGITTPDGLIPGTRLFLALEGEREGRLVPFAEAVVVWHKPTHGLGLAFTRLRTFGLQTLDALLPKAPQTQSSAAPEPATPHVSLILRDP